MSPTTTVTTLGCLLAAVIVVAAQSGEKHGHGHGHGPGHGHGHGPMEGKEECMKEIGVTKETMARKSGEEPSKQVGCVMACMMEKSKKMTASGELVFPERCPEEMKTKIQNCMAENPTDDKCEKALRAMKCFKANRGEGGRKRKGGKKPEKSDEVDEDDETEQP